MGYHDGRANLNNSERGRTYVTGAEVVALLERIEHHRDALAAEQATFQDWLDGSDELYERWSAFIQAGGVTAHEFGRFLNDRPFRHRRVRQRRHLRLVASNSGRRHVLRRSGGDEAA
jgi:hypothetical protein